MGNLQPGSGLLVGRGRDGGTRHNVREARAVGALQPRPARLFADVASEEDEAAFGQEWRKEACCLRVGRALRVLGGDQLLPQQRRLSTGLGELCAQAALGARRGGAAAAPQRLYLLL